MNSDSKIYVAGHRGMVGAGTVRALQAKGYTNIVTRTRAELDLTNSVAVDQFLADEKPDVIVVAAAKVGGIHANNTYPAEFIYENLASAQNCIHGAYKHGVGRVLFLGSSCIYPKLAEQPMREDALLTGPLEPTNEAYAIAKIAGLKLCEYYRKQYGVCYHSAMPTNLYGPRDNYHGENSHVLPALLRRFHEAKESGAPSITLWGTGSPMREFLHVDDLAAALVYLLELEEPPDLVNVGYGSDVTIKELAEIIRDVVGFEGELVWDTSRPDGSPRKLMDSSRMRALGWTPQIDLPAGVRQTYASFLEEMTSGELRA
ncbi:GDP-L-fucose synthase family protein [Cerasicoccus arenae]|uniref:GDP-L-fucose synthase n=1 Tax=Cerasicoccus arenae TaxID=424488 RepID=A0A8J3GFB2_9BACT|nr:GDP-L-fucose synthase [Cerasicoccus arenae]MBK1858620.1 GDP-L-fucose synthase [Cerasicoccus arenae]GHC04954.1 GDP-L-fucose synthase [Cerasicoccus arenae]